MAIKPTEAKALTQEEQDAVKANEKVIDAALRTYNGVSHNILLKEVPHKSERVLRQTKQLYESAGWTVEERSEGKDGPYWSLSE